MGPVLSSRCVRVITWGRWRGSLAPRRRAEQSRAEPRSMAPSSSRSRHRRRHGPRFFSDGCFAAVASQVVWLAAFLAGVTALAAGVTYPQQTSAFVLPDACGAGLSDYSAMYTWCFASFMSCTLQACVASIAPAVDHRIPQAPPRSAAVQLEVLPRASLLRRHPLHPVPRRHRRRRQPVLAGQGWQARLPAPGDQVRRRCCRRPGCPCRRRCPLRRFLHLLPLLLAVRTYVRLSGRISPSL